MPTGFQYVGHFYINKSNETLVKAGSQECLSNERINAAYVAFSTTKHLTRRKP